MKIILNLKTLSVNKAWQGKRFRTQEYKDWQKDFLWKLKEKKIKKVSGNVKISIEWGHKNANSADIDNPIKLILDRIVEAEMIDDDRKIQELFVRKRKSEFPFIKIVINKLTK